MRSDSLDSLKDFAPFDVILDPVGANYADLNIKLLGVDSRWVLIGLMGGREAQLDMGPILAKRIHLLGSTLRSRDDTFKADLMRDLGQNVWPLFTEGRLNPQLARSFPIADAEAAYAELASNKVSGKVVVIIDESLV